MKPSFDISRVSLADTNYSGVRMQQGRVLTDDDFNSSNDIIDEVTRLTEVDIIGSYGSPDDGFLIENLAIADGLVDFTIHDGTIYLGGLRFEMELTKDPVSHADVFQTFKLQKSWLQKIPTAVPTTADITDPDGRYDLVYLEGWQQPVSAVEDSSLLEMALGGPDTTTRILNLARVNIFPDTTSPECPISWKKLKETWLAGGIGKINSERELIPDCKLLVAPVNTGLPEDLCAPSVVGGYLGAENQAIRVQIITAPTLATPQGKFTWGFDNASPYYRVRVTLVNGVSTVEMLKDPKDQYHWPLAQQVVEILPWSAVLDNVEKVAEQSGFLSKVQDSYDPDTRIFTLAKVLPANFGDEWENRTDKADLISTDEKYFYMRVWNRGSDTTAKEQLDFTPGTAVPLGNTGLEITFTGTNFIPEDFWVIAARPATPTLFVPWNLKTGASPHGVRRFLSPLAIIHWTIDNNGAITGKIIRDCRNRFHPLTSHECCCTFTVGDGVYSRGDFQSLQAAIDHLPEMGGKICVLPGIHVTRAVIEHGRFIEIVGCGERSILWAEPPKGETFVSPPIIHIIHSQHIKIVNLTMFTSEGMAILVTDDKTRDTPSRHITIKDNWIFAFIHAVRVDLQGIVNGNNFIKIYCNKIVMFDKAGGDVAIFSLADEVLIERNRIVLIKATDGGGGGGDDGGDTPPPPFDDCNCDDLKKIFHQKEQLRNIIDDAAAAADEIILRPDVEDYKAKGGIQIGCSSETVKIIRNEIIGGTGCGVLIGHGFGGQESKFFPAIYHLFIEDNSIYMMGTAGIGVLQLAGVRPQGETIGKIKTPVITVIDLGIHRNKISFCAIQIPRDDEQGTALTMGYGGIILSFCESCCITGNRIVDNGQIHTEPVCGIFIQLGAELDISNNYINNNGPKVISVSDTRARPGLRGGIVILLAIQLVQFEDVDDQSGKLLPIPFYAGLNALKLHDNVVRQPLGHALFLLALGPVSVVSNQLASAGVDRRDIRSVLAATVLILNLGLSKDLFAIRTASFSKVGIIHGANLSYSNAINTAKGSAELALFEYWPSGKVMFAANQIMLDLRTIEISGAYSSILILSLDDIAFNSNQSECAGFIISIATKPISDVVLINTILLGITVRANDNRFTDGLTDVKLSLGVKGLIATVTDNQATHCIAVIAKAGVPRFELKDHNIVIYDDECGKIVGGILAYYSKNV